MARFWFSIRVELVEGGGRDFWPRPGRLFAAAPTHTFADLATAIDTAFARWDRTHLHAFEFGDGSRIGSTIADWDQPEPDEVPDSAAVKLSRLQSGERFVYVYDFGDDWTHLCTAEAEPINPEETTGIIPFSPLPYFGWGDIPDQYGRRWAEDDGEAKPPPNPRKADLPPLRPRWGPTRSKRS